MPAPHPALALFSRLFKEAAEDPNTIHTPEFYVGRSEFHAECKKAGIEIPENIMRQMDWEEEIGLRDHVRKTIRAHHKSRGTQPGPRAKAEMRLWKLR